MTKLVGAFTATQAAVLAVAIVGCATAATVTGHMSTDQYTSLLLTIGGGGIAVTGAHVGGNVASSTAAAPLPAPSPPAPALPAAVDNAAAPAPSAVSSAPTGGVV